MITALPIIVALLASGGLIFVQPPPDAPRALSPDERVLQALVHTDIEVEFDETPAREAFRFIAAALGITVVGRYSDDATGFGIDPETPISIRRAEMRGLDAVVMILAQCEVMDECAWQTRGGFLEVGTKERLSLGPAQVIKTYPIDDLLFEAPDFEDAPTFRLEDELGTGVIAHPGVIVRGRPYYRGFGGTYWPYQQRRLNGLNGFGGMAFGASTASPRQGTRERQAAAQNLIELITSVIEPQVWDVNGGTGGTIAYSHGMLVVKAPEFVHRQLGGVPPIPPPVGDQDEGD